jgi:hypothetical protein
MSWRAQDYFTFSAVISGLATILSRLQCNSRVNGDYFFVEAIAYTDRSSYVVNCYLLPNPVGEVCGILPNYQVDCTRTDEVPCKLIMRLAPCSLHGILQAYSTESPILSSD